MAEHIFERLARERGITVEEMRAIISAAAIATLLHTTSLTMALSMSMPTQSSMLHGIAAMVRVSMALPTLTLLELKFA